jgi:hypothetical protein
LRRGSFDDRGLHPRALELGLGVEHGQEALGHQVEYLQLVLTHSPDVVLGASRDDRVVVLHLVVVDHALERKPFQ